MSVAEGPQHSFVHNRRSLCRASTVCHSSKSFLCATLTCCHLHMMFCCPGCHQGTRRIAVVSMQLSVLSRLNRGYWDVWRSATVTRPQPAIISARSVLLSFWSDELMTTCNSPPAPGVVAARLPYMSYSASANLGLDKDRSYVCYSTLQGTGPQCQWNTTSLSHSDTM
jgi:hypothetical protein